jgi:hypothetical protein
MWRGDPMTRVIWHEEDVIVPAELAFPPRIREAS